MKRFLTILSVILVMQCAIAQATNPLIFPFDKKYGQVEVGGPFVGVEFHKSRPLPSRISFYYPVANSIDLSTDYWKRDESRPFAFGVKIGNEKKKWIGRDGWRYELSPHTVTFFDEDAFISYQLKYEFCLNEPAMVVSLTMINKTKTTQQIATYSQLLLALRTCQTYSRKDSSAVRYISENQTIVAKFSDSDTKLASTFVVNAGEKASKIWCDANELSVTDGGLSLWIDSSLSSSAERSNDPKRTRGVAAFEYSKLLQPGDTMTIVQVIGSSTQNEAEQKISTLSKEWKSKVELYNNFVTATSTTDTYFHTNDSIIDRTVKWSKAILTSNAHYLNGQIVPMPCPAEYNFFFTHDLLMTNLGAVNYDLNRVKQDLLYVSSLAQDSIIPHAYYWRDDAFKTELCTPSNWNHLWFIEVSASYLRHSLDTTTLRQLYPLISKSLTEVMTQLNNDHLMHAFRPDWWDLGWKEGSRTYITALSIRAIEDYLFIASFIDHKNPSLLGLEKNAIEMRSALVSKLWDDSLNYLINYNGIEKDNHKYMGSLIVPAYHLLDHDKSQKMIESVKKDLLAPNTGIRAVMPSDFHKDSVIKYFKIAGNEAGDEYTYINGGVWPHNNAWFALALNSIGKSKEALEFVKQTMTIDGIANSPNGIPAMYEYRYSNESSPRYGEIDKPSFLWAGGFYIYTMYTLAGMNDNVWNLSVSADRAQFDSTVRFNYQFETIKDVMISGKGRHLESFTANAKKIPSLILPLGERSRRNLSFSFGNISEPYLVKANTIVHAVEYAAAKKQLSCKVSSFNGHYTTLNIIAQKKPRQVLRNGKSVKSFVTTKNPDNTFDIAISFVAGISNENILVKW
ncbi:MAG: amylo-alpha-1,6-glucosidase [Bacteroidota bacterium]|nr:amylo-alpha-1,6-glucosidase [Bacteroidota bacterium]